MSLSMLCDHLCACIAALLAGPMGGLHPSWGYQAFHEWYLSMAEIGKGMFVPLIASMALALQASAHPLKGQLSVYSTMLALRTRLGYAYRPVTVSFVTVQAWLDKCRKAMVAIGFFDEFKHCA